MGGSAAVAQLVRPSSPSPGALPTPERRSALSAPSPSTGAWDSGLGRHEPRRGPAGAPRGRSGADGAEASGELWGPREAGGRAAQMPGPRSACAGRWWERRGSRWQGRVREAGDGAECGRPPETQPGGTAARTHRDSTETRLGACSTRTTVDHGAPQAPCTGAGQAPCAHSHAHSRAHH